MHLAGSARVTVRYDEEELPPKNGKIRRLELGAEAVRVAQRWLTLLPSRTPHNPKGLMWPLPRSSRRDDTRLIRRWHDYLGLAKVRDAMDAAQQGGKGKTPATALTTNNAAE